MIYLVSRQVDGVKLSGLNQELFGTVRCQVSALPFCLESVLAKCNVETTTMIVTEWVEKATGPSSVVLLIGENQYYKTNGSKNVKKAKLFLSQASSC